MHLLEFYTKTLTSFNLVIDDTQVKLENGKELKLGSLPVCMPTRENVTTMIGPTGVPTKVIFNPLIEDIYSRKQSDKSLTKLITLGKINLSFSLASIATLLMGAVDKKQAGFTISSFLSTLIPTIDNAGIKKIIDEKALTTIHKIFLETIQTDIEPIKITQTKNGKVSDDKYSIVTSVYSPLLDHILEVKEREGKVESIAGINVRPKDVGTITAIIKYMLSFDTENVIRLGSNSNQPGFESLLTMYLTIANHFNTVAEELRAIDIEAYETALIKLDLKLEDLANLAQLSIEAKMFPSEASIVKAEVVKEEPVARVNPLLQNLNNAQSRATAYQSPSPGYAHGGMAMNMPTQQPAQPNMDNMSDYQRAKMALAGTNIVVNQIPNVNQYHGPRPDLHVGNIYNNAQPYQNPLLAQPSYQGNQNNYIPQQNNQPNYYNGSNQQSRIHVSFAEKQRLAEMQSNPYLR